VKGAISGQLNSVKVPIQGVVEHASCEDPPEVPLQKGDKLEIQVVLDPPVPLGLRILVADDSALTRKMACRLLSTIGCICTEAEDGLEAYNLVISDLSLFDVVLIE
jgi:PleD family two-component response regulator